jgi:membrane-associated protease RseP (regulator of RpoE activity)
LLEVPLSYKSIRMPGSITCALLSMTLVVGASFPPESGGGAVAVPVKLPGKDESPIYRDGLPGAGKTTPAPKRKMFGLGIGFLDRANAQGIPLEQVVPGSPAERAGLAPGTVIAEINGDSTLGRNREECTRMIRESGNKVTLKYYDPVTLKLRTRTLEKDWFFIPSDPS